MTDVSLDARSRDYDACADAFSCDTVVAFARAGVCPPPYTGAWEDPAVLQFMPVVQEPAATAPGA